MSNYTDCMHFENGTESESEESGSEEHPQQTYRTDYTLVLGYQQKEFLKTYQTINLRDWRMLVQVNHNLDWSYIGTTVHNDKKERNENIRKNYKYYWP